MTYRKKRFIFGFTIFILLLLFYYLNMKIGDSTFIYGELSVSTFFPNMLNSLNNSQNMCKRPELNLWEPTIASHFKKSPPISCNEEPDWVCLEKGVASICNETTLKHGDVNCEYTFLQRASDLRTVEDVHLESPHSKPLELAADFFQVKCTNNQRYKWKNIMAGIHYNKAIHKRTGWQYLSPKAMKLNVLIWGFDSLSRLTFIRKLPKTYEYLKQHLDAVVLESYNIVGDGTPQALIPILTGKTELELPETRKRMDLVAQHVNVYPFVWNDYASTGYVTGYAEDSPGIGTFTYRLRGFGIQPTDHYMRTFYIAAEQEYSDHEKYCLRGTPRHKVLMNWVKQFFEMYKTKPKFLFTFHSELSHDDYNRVGSADEDLLEMLKDLKDKKLLADTLLIVMSDHGHRFSSFRETQQGKLEERLPFFAFSFPPWFKKKFPRAYKNFKLNKDRLTTPFDIYSTLKDILHFDERVTIGNIKNRSISLFKQVPVERTCADADIEPHWCTCLNTKPVSVNDVIVVNAAKAVVDFMNEFTKFKRDVCEILSLHSIVKASQYIPTDGLLRFKQNADPDGFVPDLSDNTAISTELYELKLYTKPGNGHFEATVVHQVQKKSFEVKLTDISRINKYGKAAKCIEDSQPQLRPYCYCKNAT